MKKKLYFIIPLIMICGIAGATFLPESNFLKKEATKKTQQLNDTKNNTNEISKSLSCKSCHENEYPTKKDPGLRSCPRDKMVSEFHSPQEGPEVVVIDEMSDNYTGVKFSHRIHSSMSAMSTGCTDCHHYNTTGPLLNCRECHSASRSREDVTVPDLKAAFHRQCMSCHKEWSHENGCSTQCHLPKGSGNQNLNQKDLTNKTHPVLTEPDKMVWQTKYEPGRVVTFFHNEHNQLFKISCKSCHSSDNCSTCHDVNRPKDANNTSGMIQKSSEEHHKPCMNCHTENNCQKCHKEKEMQSFNHGRTTGWILKPYHSKLECTKCHGNSMPFRNLDNNCVSCHKNFTPGNFDHKVIGFTMSENHKDMECISCHINNDFSKSPECKMCHDDKSPPAQLPGKRTR